MALAKHPPSNEGNETKDFRQGGDKGNDDWSQGIDINLFLYHDATAGEWVLEDLSNLGDKKSNRAKGAADAPVPAALFAQLNSRLRFPPGALYYRVPDEGSYRILRTKGDMPVSEWIRWAAMVGLAVGITAMTMGAALPAEIIMIGSAVAMAGAEVAAMTEEHQQGMLTRERVMVHSALIASCILGGTSASLGMLTRAGLVGRGAIVTRVVAGMQVGADGVCFAVFTTEAFEGHQEAAKDPEGLTFTRLMAFFLQMGMNGMMLYGIKGSLGEAAGVHGVGNEAAKGLHRAGGKPKPRPRSEVHEEFVDDLHVSGSQERPIFESNQIGLRGVKERLLQLVGGDISRSIRFTDAELTDFLQHAKSLGFGAQDIEAILIVKLRKPTVSLDSMKKVAASLAEKAKNNDIGFKEGWDFMRAYRVAQERMLQGGVLEPSEYLVPRFVDEHLREFGGKGSYLVTGVNYVKYILDQPMIGFPDGQYLSTPARIDGVLAKANGDIAIVEKELGIPEGWWQGQQGIYRVDVSNAEAINLRIPKGNEMGANEFWCPGGSTSGGVKEGVVDRIPAKNFKVNPKPVIE